MFVFVLHPNAQTQLAIFFDSWEMTVDRVHQCGRLLDPVSYFLCCQWGIWPVADGQHRLCDVAPLALVPLLRARPQGNDTEIVRVGGGSGVVQWWFRVGSEAVQWWCGGGH